MEQGSPEGTVNTRFFSVFHGPPCRPNPEYITLPLSSFLPGEIYVCHPFPRYPILLLCIVNASHCLELQINLSAVPIRKVNKCMTLDLFLLLVRPKLFERIFIGFQSVFKSITNQILITVNQLKLKLKLVKLKVTFRAIFTNNEAFANKNLFS